MRCRVLVIEDDDALADVLTMRLERDGHRPTVASNQRDAYHLLDDERFDFVLLDLRLPSHDADMDPSSEVGFAILDHIRDRFAASQLPVIVMTAYEETSQTAVRALKAMANDYITKPFDDSPVSLDEKLAAIVRSLREVAPAATGPARKHRLVFAREGVAIDGVTVVGSRFTDLLRLLGSRTLMLSRDRDAGDDPRMTGKELATALDVQEATVRQYVTRFRKWIAGEFERRGLGALENDEIIRNVRDWKGYELNFEACAIHAD